MLTSYLKKLIRHENLSAQESSAALEIILRAENVEQIAAFLVLIRAKGETVDEMVAFVKVMQQHSLKMNVDIPVMDIVGTGGDGAHTANISTAASILAASCGVPVLKHGNRAVSSQAGAADVLQALGVNIEQTPEQVIYSLKKCQLAFCFAPKFNPAMGALKPIRTQLKVPTFFNILGPLLNPAKASYMLLGVFDPRLMQLMANILIQLDVKRAMVVHGSGLDELNCLGACDVIEINQGVQQHYQLHPNDLGLSVCHLSDLKGGSAQENARSLQQIIEGQPSLLAQTVIFNAAAAVYLYGLASDIKQGIKIVKENIANGRAKDTLKQFIAASVAENFYA